MGVQDRRRLSDRRCTHCPGATRIPGERRQRQAEARAAQLKDEFTSTEHFLLALAAEGGRAPSADLLKQLGVTPEGVLQLPAASRPFSDRLALMPSFASPVTARARAAIPTVYALTSPVRSP